MLTILDSTSEEKNYSEAQGVPAVDFPGRVIESFLMNHPGSFCTDCLAQILEIPAGQVSMAIRRLQDVKGFRSEPGVCSECRRKVSVIKAELAG